MSIQDVIQEAKQIVVPFATAAGSELASVIAGNRAAHGSTGTMSADALHETLDATLELVGRLAKAAPGGADLGSKLDALRQGVDRALALVDRVVTLEKELAALRRVVSDLGGTAQAVPVLTTKG